MGQNNELNIYIDYLISKPLTSSVFFPVVTGKTFAVLFSNWQVVLLKVCCRNVQM